jgi:hypothetical protein
MNCNRKIKFHLPLSCNPLTITISTAIIDNAWLITLQYSSFIIRRTWIIHLESDWLQYVIIMGIICTYNTLCWIIKLFCTSLILYLDSQQEKKPRFILKIIIFVTYQTISKCWVRKRTTLKQTQWWVESMRVWSVMGYWWWIGA